MVGMRAKTKFDQQKVRRKVRQGNITSLGHAAATIRLTAKGSIRKRKGKAPEGSPPHTHKKRLKASILYAIDKAREMALIGPSHRIVGIAGAEHEHGGKWRDESFPQRSFMVPALKKTSPRLPKHWAGSVR